MPRTGGNRGSMRTGKVIIGGFLTLIGISLVLGGAAILIFGSGSCGVNCINLGPLMAGGLVVFGLMFLGVGALFLR